MALQDSFVAGSEGGKVSPVVLSAPNIATAGGVYMAKLGDYMFSLDTSAFQELSRNTEYRWTSQKRLNRKPSAQFSGQDDDTIELSGTVYPHFRGGLAQIDQLRAIAGTGKALPLIYAFNRTGQYNGLWCIRSIRETRKEFFNDGTCRKIEFSLSLLAYGEDAGTASPAVVSIPRVVAEAVTLVNTIPAGMQATAVIENETEVGSLELWSPDKPLSVLNKISETMTKVTGTINGLITASQTKLDGIVDGLQSQVDSLIPPETLKAAKDLYTAGKAAKEQADQVREQFDVLKNAPDALRSAAKKFENDLLSSRRQFVQLGGILKGDAIKLSNVQQTGESLAKHRITAAASLRNASRSADELIFAANETARQIATLGGLIKDE